MNAAVSGQASLFSGDAPVRPTLRPYQERGVSEILACLERGIDPLYALPTAGGKTTIFTAVTEVVCAQGWEVWILVHRRELLKQASDRLLSMGISHGLIAPGAPLTNDPVQVASIDTIGARLEQLRDRLARVRLAIIDEAHHVVASKWQRALEAMRRARRLGVTATAFRYDGKGLGEHFNQAIEGPAVAELIRDGYLARPAIFAPPAKIDLSKVKKRGGDYVAADLAKAVDTDELTLPAVRHYARICGGVPAVVFCAGVEHARHVAKQFQAGGWSAASIDGEMTVAERDRAIRQLATGRLSVLTSCDIISEGTDLPVVGAAILLRPTESTGLYLQQVGRVLRTHPGKTEAIIIDQVGNVAKHGMPDERRVWSLDGGLKGLERAVTATRRCRYCHFVCAKGPERCPHCSRAYPKPPVAAVPEVALAVMPGIAGLSAERIAAMKYKDILPLAKTEEDLQRVAAIKGYKRSWVKRVLEERAAATAYGFMQRRYA
ncbi:DEAD/DEAH box helicase [Azospirillum sp. Vi22]|uniref:DEAD/DEAH box helicase n=1 Tax=Azospirillum baldaniorum TaxID=1064539 RepID=UPI00157A37DA|nr:DEAD/DEAH box helicase [Azospirillum baldaniorum]NUB07028.1 DEAD/DEAH box helicase [Azospirillum baldaniorum]